MKIISIQSLAIPDVKVIKVGRFIDNRGYFTEPFRKSDLRAHPKRYVNISVFGKKDKGGYLTQPLADSTTSPVK